MASFFRKNPIYLFLLPLFFVLHGVNENYGHIPFGDAAVLTLYYIAAVIIVALVVYIFFRNIRKTALITGVIFSIYFFFGALHDFLKAYSPVVEFSRYRFILSVLTLILIGTIVFCTRTKGKLLKLTSFLNLLFGVYIVVLIFSMILKSMNADVRPKLAIENTMTPCADCKKPDIWFLIFDAYASTGSLEKYHNFKNPIDSFLLQKGFSIQYSSRSNYNLTPFSIASILNMSYVNGIADPMMLTAENYIECNQLIRENQLTRFLQKQGYDIVNYSIFDLPGDPTLVKKTFLPLKTNLIKENTLDARVSRDMGEWLFTYFPFKYFTDHPFVPIDKANHDFIELTKKAATDKKSSPRFVYMHVYMPHRPYFYDRHGNRKADTTVVREFFEKSTPAYLDYILYTNKKVEELINTIQHNNREAVIVFMGDHGHRSKYTESFPRQHFMNMNAVYFPDGDYKGFYDSISGVNQFRVVLNKLFRQSIPLLKDSVTLVMPASQFKRS